MFFILWDANISDFEMWENITRVSLISNDLIQCVRYTQTFTHHLCYLSKHWRKWNNNFKNINLVWKVVEVQNTFHANSFVVKLSYLLAKDNLKRLPGKREMLLWRNNIILLQDFCLFTYLIWPIVHNFVKRCVPFIGPPWKELHTINVVIIAHRNCKCPILF